MSHDGGFGYPVAFGEMIFSTLDDVFFYTWILLDAWPKLPTFSPIQIVNKYSKIQLFTRPTSQVNQRREILWKSLKCDWLLDVGCSWQCLQWWLKWSFWCFRLFRTLSFWLDEPRLHDPNLYVLALPPNYQAQLLITVFQNQTVGH